MHTFKTTDVSDVTLLSAEEAKALPREVLACGKWWWLRSPGFNDDRVAGVYDVGSLDEYGYDVHYVNGAVRPAFRIPNLKSSNLKVGDMIEVVGIGAIVISDTMALAKVPVGYAAFREDYKAADANDYETSDIKKWLEDWWQEQIDAETKA